ncbi:MAG TPA: methylenetetrahydrofolate reductase [NAD(P)H] [Acidobacteriota bacterium]|nr:methylenetetrahydrofolate reductase [NAD(P)H] [Acidobacteriota bacterium]
MRFADHYRSATHPVFSFELFPPKGEKGMRALERRLPKLVTLEPSFITVTYGAMGSTRERTLEIAKLIRSHGMETAHHLTCVGATRQELNRQIEEIAQSGIENIVALRGDPPQGSKEFVAPDGGFSNASQLVELIRNRGEMGVAVAGYPEKHVEAPDFESDLKWLKHKVDCGADVVITQLFYRNRSFFRFQERCRELGIAQPIVPGLLPILSTHQIRRISSICGCTIPQGLLEELMEAGEDEDKVCEIGIRYTVEQAAELLAGGVPGIHFYVLNRYFHINEIMQRLREKIGQSTPA